MTATLPANHWLHKAIAKAGAKPVKLEIDPKSGKPAAASVNQSTPANTSPAPSVVGPENPKGVAASAPTGKSAADAFAAAGSPPTEGVGVPTDQRSTFDFVKQLGAAVNSGMLTGASKPPVTKKGQ